MPPEEPVWSPQDALPRRDGKHHSETKTSTKPRSDQVWDVTSTCSRRPWQSAFAHDTYPDIHMKAVALRLSVLRSNFLVRVYHWLPLNGLLVVATDSSA